MAKKQDHSNKKLIVCVQRKWWQEWGGLQEIIHQCKSRDACSQNNKNRITTQKEGATSRKVRNNIEAET